MTILYVWLFESTWYSRPFPCTLRAPPEPREGCGSTRRGADARVSPHRSSETYERCSGARTHPGMSVRVSQGDFSKRTVSGWSSSSASCGSIVIFSFGAVSERGQGAKVSGHAVRQRFDIWHDGKSARPIDLNAIRPGIGAVEPGSVRMGMRPLRRTLWTIRPSFVVCRFAGLVQQAGPNSLSAVPGRVAQPRKLQAWCPCRRGVRSSAMGCASSTRATREARV
jgi:hypothetical protein